MSLLEPRLLEERSHGRHCADGLLVGVRGHHLALPDLQILEGLMLHLLHPFYTFDLLLLFLSYEGLLAAEGKLG